MERLRIVSINTGSATTIELGRRSFVTGIDKRPVSDCAAVGCNGLDGDEICDTGRHGGPDQAIYAYSVADYAWWSGQLGRSLSYGSFGENLTVEGLPSDMNAGDRLLAGTVLLEATAPRIPCSTLSAFMGDPSFGMAFRRAERPGFYFRVLSGGELCAGEAITLIENPEESVSMLDLFRLAYASDPPAALLERALNAPIAERLRDRFRTQADASGT